MTDMTNISGFGLRPQQNWSAGADQAPAPASGGYTRLSVVDKALGAQQPLGTNSSFVSNSFMANSASPHFDAQGLLGGMSRVGNPYTSSDDHLLVTALKNALPLLGKFMEDGALTVSGLEKIAAEEVGTSSVSERNIMLAMAIRNRPRVTEAIKGPGGKITLESLEKAVDLVVGNTDPNTQSADPFHSKSNRQVVTALLSRFDQLRDKSEDFVWPFDKHRFVKVDTLIEISKDPDELDNKGNVVRDPATGFPKKKHTELDVYLAQALNGRTGLLAELDGYKANGYAIFGSRNHDGWLKKQSLERWLENDKKEKGD